MKFKRPDVIIIILAFGLLISVLYVYKTRPYVSKPCQTEEIFINSDLACDEDPSANTKELKESTEKVVEKYLANNTAQKISVFYRDLVNRQWFGIDENDPFTPGSLLKLPLAIAYYKLSEIDPVVLGREYQYQQSHNFGARYAGQHFKPTEDLIPGDVYTVREMIARMLEYSDNEVVPILSSAINNDFLKKVYIDLGIYLPTPEGVEYNLVSVKAYGAILRSLYNASYLNRSGSNEILSVMSKSDFRSGLVAGVPSSVKVANKFGERSIISGDQINYAELHDCGVIYASTNPYILCIMTKGRDFNELSKVITDISQIIYSQRQ